MGGVVLDWSGGDGNGNVGGERTSRSPLSSQCRPVRESGGVGRSRSMERKRPKGILAEKVKEERWRWKQSWERTSGL